MQTAAKKSPRSLGSGGRAPAAAPAAPQPQPLRWPLHALALVALPALVWLLYRRTLDGPLFFDDQTAIVFNTLIQSLHPLAKFLASNRPLTDLTFALNYAHGGSAARGYHLVNVAIHAINVLLAYALLNRTLQAPALRPRYGRGAPLIALAAAAAFAAHPLQTETVAYVSSRTESLAALFYMASVLLYAIAATTPRRGLRLACTAALPLSVASALASKEMAATIPAALVLYDWCFIAQGRLRDVAARWRLLLPVLLPFALGVVILLRRDLGSTTAGFHFQRITPREYLLTEFGVVVHYLRLIVFPRGLCFDTDWRLAHSPWSVAVLAPLALLLALLGGALAVVRRHPLLTFAVLWIFVILAPTSSIIPIADPVAERRMYLALLGPALLAAAAFWTAAGRLSAWRPSLAPLRSVVYVSLASALVVTLSVLTTDRVAGAWLSTVSLYRDTVAKAPGNPRARLNLGASYLFRGKLDQAEEQLVTAEKLFDAGESVQAFDRVGAYIALNLCDLRYRRGELDEATRECDRALELGRRFVVLRPMVALYLGHIAVARRQWDRAIAYYKITFRFGSPGIRLHVLLHMARTYMIMGQMDLARQALEAVLHKQPDNPEAARMLRALTQATPR